MRVFFGFEASGAFARRPVLLGLMGMALALGGPAAHALDAPQGKVVLTLSGKIGAPNDGTTAKLDMAMIRKLPQVSFTTQTPWEPKPVTFTGPRLKDVLALVKGQGQQLVAAALNDYKITIPMADLDAHGVLLAHQMDGADIPVRTKGPLFIVYPFDSKPELKSTKFYERSIWQLKAIEVQ